MFIGRFSAQKRRRYHHPLSKEENRNGTKTARRAVSESQHRRNKTWKEELELKEYAKHRAWEIAKIYRDTISGAKDCRPALNELMADARRRKVDIVLVWKFDRFARSVTHLLSALEQFRSVGIEFVSLSEQIDTSTAGRRLTFTVLAAVSELERSLITERVLMGIQNARKKGKILGRPPIR
jgi:DNA invertase Pin-like site-specific DNA recombinase